MYTSPLLKRAVVRSPPPRPLSGKDGRFAEGEEKVRLAVSGERDSRQPVSEQRQGRQDGGSAAASTAA